MIHAASDEAADHQRRTGSQDGNDPPGLQDRKDHFPIVVSLVVILLLPSTAPLIGCLMLGNLWRECGVTERLSDTVQNALMNIVTVFLGISVGATTVASSFLTLNTLKIVVLGLLAFCFSTVGVCSR